MASLNRIELQKLISEELETLAEQGVFDRFRSSGAKVSKDISKMSGQDLNPGKATTKQSGKVFLSQLVSNRLRGAGLDPSSGYYKKVYDEVEEFFELGLKQAGVADKIEIVKEFKFNREEKKQLLQKLINIPRTDGDKLPTGVLVALVNDVELQLNANASILDQAQPETPGTGPSGEGISKTDLIDDPRLIAGVVLTALTQSAGPGQDKKVNMLAGQLKKLLADDPQLVSNYEKIALRLISRTPGGDPESGLYSLAGPDVNESFQKIKISRSGLAQAIKILLESNELSNNK